MWNNNEREFAVNNYKSAFDEFGIDSKSLFIPKSQQHACFSALHEITNDMQGSVLDIGCGFADLYPFLKAQGFKGNYTGIDIVPEFIEVCKNKYPDAEFKLIDILTEDINQKWDWVLLSGTLNLKLENGNQLDFIKSMLKKMHQLCHKGFAADFLSNNYKNQHKDFYHANPNDIWNITQSITPRLSIRQDFIPYIFTVYGYKNIELTDGEVYKAVSYGIE